jgi:hypothetical protein
LIEIGANLVSGTESRPKHAIEDAVEFEHADIVELIVKRDPKALEERPLGMTLAEFCWLHSGSLHNKTLETLVRHGQTLGEPSNAAKVQLRLHHRKGWWKAEENAVTAEEQPENSQQ